MWCHVIQLSALLANSLRCSPKARTANKISLPEITLKTFHNRRPSPLLRSHFKVDMARRIGAWHTSVCGRFQASVKLPREALEDEERSRRDSPPLSPYMPLAILRVILVIGFSHAILCHEILQDFTSYDEN